MASLINYEGIDETFPVAGQDNETQGFRENFSVIKNSLEAAKGEVETLQETTAKTNTASNFSGNNIVNANLVSVTAEKFAPSSSLIAGSTLSFLNGHYQIFVLGANVTLTLADWPISGKAASMIVEVYSDAVGVNRTVTFSAPTGEIKKSNLSSDITKPAATSAALTVSSTVNPTIIEIWTYNGSLFFIRSLGSFSS
jgi:hypothetical protein